MPTEKFRSPPSSKLLFAVETITGKHNWLKCREQLDVRCQAPVDTSLTKTLNLRLREHLRRGDRNMKVRGMGSLL